MQQKPKANRNQPGCRSGWALACPSEHPDLLRPPSSSPSGPSPAHSISVSLPSTVRAGMVLFSCVLAQTAGFCASMIMHSSVHHILVCWTPLAHRAVICVGATPVNKTNNCPGGAFIPGRKHNNDSAWPLAKCPTCLASNSKPRAGIWSPEPRVYNLHFWIWKPEPKTA